MRRLLATASAVGIAACTLTTSLDGLSGGDDTPPPGDGSDAFVNVPEAGATDADASPDVDVLPDGAGVNVFPEGSFEEGGTQVCQGANFHSTVSTITSRPYEGKQACRVCADGPGTEGFSLDVRIPAAPVVVGATYQAIAYVRKPQNENPPTDPVYLNVRTYDDPPFAPVEIATESTTIDTEWRQILVNAPITKPAQGLDIYISSGAGTNVCFIVDGVSLVRTK